MERKYRIIWFLVASVALMTTGFGITMPIFARRLGEFGSGVEALGVMTMAFALAQLLGAPVLGGLADRLGRRPLVLLALAAFALANLGYLWATSTPLFIGVRFLGGLFTAGLFPAAMGMVADTVPEERRAKWIGIVMGGYATGIVFGPVIGGLLYDGWGFHAPFTISAGLAVAALIAAVIFVPETYPVDVRRRDKEQQQAAPTVASQNSLWRSLPRPLAIFGTLLLVDFIGAFAFAFIEPQMVFYLYDDLGWSTVEFGIVVGAYGLAMVAGQTLLGQLSDTFGRKPVIIVGILLNVVLYATIAYITYFPLILVNSAIAGLGAALITPAVSAFYLDITAKQHRARIMGLKEAALASGGVIGPLAVTVATGFMSSQGIFVLAGGLFLAAAGLALLLLREPQRPAGPSEANTPVQETVATQTSYAI